MRSGADGARCVLHKMRSAARERERGSCNATILYEMRNGASVGDEVLHEVRVRSWHWRGAACFGLNPDAKLRFACAGRSRFSANLLARPIPSPNSHSAHTESSHHRRGNTCG